MPPRIAAFLSILLMLSGLLSPVHAEDAPLTEELRTINGSVSEVDTDNKRLTIHWLANESLMKYEDITLDVPDSTAIMKEAEAIALDDLENGDEVTLRYDANALPLPKVINLTVSET